jgi:hypothetical protein
MIGQYLSNTNESATVLIFQNFLELNKAVTLNGTSAHRVTGTGTPQSRSLSHHIRPCLVRKNFQDSPSHRIFGRMHGALNKDKNKN